MPDGRPEAAARSGVDVVENQVFHVHVRWLEAGVARVQDLPGCGGQGPHPEPERVASGVLARGEPFIRNVAGVPQPYLPLAIGGFLDLPFLACRRARRSSAAWLGRCGGVRWSRLLVRRRGPERPACPAALGDRAGAGQRPSVKFGQPEQILM